MEPQTPSKSAPTTPPKPSPSTNNSKCSTPARYCRILGQVTDHLFAECLAVGTCGADLHSKKEMDKFSLIVEESSPAMSPHQVVPSIKRRQRLDQRFSQQMHVSHMQGYHALTAAQIAPQSMAANQMAPVPVTPAQHVHIHATHTKGDEGVCEKEDESIKSL